MFRALQKSSKNDRTSSKISISTALSSCSHTEQPRSLDRSISQLEEAVTLSPRDARLLTDLAAAYFVRGQQNDQPKDFIMALATIDKAVQADGRLHPALFNRALFLQGMSLRTEAWFAWQAYLALDREPGWAEEAEAHLASIKKATGSEPAGATAPPPGRGRAARGSDSGEDQSVCNSSESTSRRTSWAGGQRRWRLDRSSGQIIC